MISLKMDNKVYKYEESYSGIKRIAKHFPMVMEILYQSPSIERAVPIIINYLSSHNCDAWISIEDKIPGNIINHREPINLNNNSQTAGHLSHRSELKAADKNNGVELYE